MGMNPDTYPAISEDSVPEVVETEAWEECPEAEAPAESAAE